MFRLRLCVYVHVHVFGRVYVHQGGREERATEVTGSKMKEMKQKKAVQSSGTLLGDERRGPFSAARL